MNNYDEIKHLVEASRKVLRHRDEKNIAEIKKVYGLIKEQEDNSNQEIKKPKMFGEERPEDEEKRTFKIQGGLISIHGKEKTELQLTLDEKVAFKESMEEFRAEVAELVDFNTLNVYQNNVEWSGLITDRDIEFFFSVSETDGTYIKGEFIKVDGDFLELVDKLKKFYEKFKAKWSKIIASRKETEK